MHTHPSSTNAVEQGQAFSSLPPGALSGPLGPTQQARLNPSTSAVDKSNLQNHPTSPTSTKESGNFDHQSRSSSMTINPSVLPAPQPGGSTASQQWQADEEAAGLTRTASNATLSDEPRIFPGVVSRSRRRSSMRSSVVEDGAYMGYRKSGDAGSVVEERDTDDGE
jgi:AMP deaminase